MRFWRRILLAETSMHTDAANADLRDIPIESIDRNSDNPRIVFRPAEMETLQESISQHGVQVPISVYREGKRFILIDGERRWRCCLKLNRKTIPALVQGAPDALTNLLLMFNIHALREQWDLMTIAVKLPKVIELLTARSNRTPTEEEISKETGLRRGVIRRCKLLIELPQKYRDSLLDELNKPKSQQKLTEDFFIEMERALKTVERAMPAVIDSKNRVRNVLIDKYREGTIRDITDFRYLPMIARADRVAVTESTAARSLTRVFEKNDYSIDRAFKDSVSEAYSERDFISRIHDVLARLDHITTRDLDGEVRSVLEALFTRLSKLLGKAR
jgi:ParB family transcriptional regulator, chromosome partitioning protein